MRRPELLAPAGSMSMLKAAVDAGADAVYLGLNQYNARIHATNFTMETLPEALEYAHLRNSKVYITLNTLIEDDELMDAVELAIDAYKLGADAFLVQDIGLASYLAAHFPQIPLHASTQMNVFSESQASEMTDFNVERVVLPRELSIDEIRSRTAFWHAEGREVEVFVHGAMCVNQDPDPVTAEHVRSHAVRVTRFLKETGKWKYSVSRFSKANCFRRRISRHYLIFVN